MSLKAIRDSFHTRFLNCRNVNNLLQTDDFELAYSKASKDERLDIEKAIGRSDKEAIKAFIDRGLLRMTPFHQMSVRKLRLIGKNLRIPNYWIKDKIILIEEIRDVVKRLKETG